MGDTKQYGCHVLYSRYPFDVTTYYVDPTVSAGGDGSIGTPFNTWAALDTAVTAAAGDIYLQKSGTTARENIVSAVVGANNIRLSTYGGSDYATITGADVATGFTYDAVYRVWSKTISTGWNVSFSGAPLNFVAWNTDIATTAPSMPDNSFTYSGTVLYVRMVGDPSGCEVSARQYVIGNTGSGFGPLTIEGFKIIGSYRHGIYVGNKIGLTIQDCEFGSCGGEFTSVFLGNQIEMYGTISAVTIRRNKFYDAFDAAISPQLAAGGDISRGHLYKDNTIDRSGYAGIECVTNSTSQILAGIEISNNLIRDCGYGWSGNRGGRAIMLTDASDNTSQVDRVTVKDNKIYHVKTGILCRDTQGTNWIIGNEIRDCLYGLVSRQALVSASHVDHFFSNFIFNASVSGHFVSGANDGVFGGAAATQAITGNVYANTFSGCLIASVNTTNANAVTNFKNNRVLGDGFSHSTGTLTETNNCVTGTAGLVLDASDVTTDTGSDVNYAPLSAGLRTSGTRVADRDFYGAQFATLPTIGAVQYRVDTRTGIASRSIAARTLASARSTSYKRRIAVG